MIAHSMLELIGHCPILHLKLRSNQWNVFLKLEKYNPGQSMKDRMALNMVNAAEQCGALKQGGTIIESSSGNTAIGLAILAAIRGYRFIAIVDHHAALEKIKLIQAYGGEIYYVGDREGHRSYVVERVQKAKELAASIPGAFFPNQADNKDNRNAYVDTLAVELMDEIGTIDEVYGSIGSGGSICGVADGLKCRQPSARVYAIEPSGSTIFGAPAHPYYQSGPGQPAGAKIPSIIDFSLMNDHFFATDGQAFSTCRYFAKRHGVLLGGSAGGVLYKALERISSHRGTGNAVLLLCDGGEKYLDTIYNDSWLESHGLMESIIECHLDHWVMDGQPVKETLAV